MAKRRMNRLLEEYLRHYVTASQKNWLELLDVAQFCYNLHKSFATSLSSFELVNGQQPLAPNEISIQASGGKCPAAYKFARAEQELIDEARDSLRVAQENMKRHTDKHRRDLQFQVGNLVMLKLMPQIYKKINSKVVHMGLAPKYDGPFEVLEKVGNVAYKLKLPDRLKVHPTFHLSYLKKYYDDQIDPEQVQTRRAPPIVLSQYTKESERILDHETFCTSKKNQRTKYLIQWKGVSEKDAEWVVLERFMAV